MARDILSEYGSDHRHSNVGKGDSGLATDGGKPYCKDVHNYQPPKGPSNIEHKGVGLGGSTHKSGSQR